jgi:3-methyladenine DNA glycosylase AlkD
MNADEVLEALRDVADPTRLAGMATVGIDVDHALGVSVPNIRRIAKRAGPDQGLARDLWATGVHEARMVAALVADPAALTLREMSSWAGGLDSWDVCDMLASTVAVTPLADRAIARWSTARHGFTKRCAFSTMATVAVHGEGRPDDDFLAWLPVIRAASNDDRNEVRKAVNWALRQIGKRNLALHAAAIAEAEAIAATGTRSGRWIASDALRELRDPATIARIGT